MKILVCIKQVPDSETRVEIDARDGRIRIDQEAKHWMNHADEFAVEEAVRIKETLPDTVIDVLTVGPERAAQVLERAMGMGANQAFHLLAPEADYRSPFVTASWIGAVAADRGYDLILAGVMAQDDMQAQVGPILAELLGRPCATSVIFVEIRPEQGAVYVEREVEGGRRHMLELDLPAVLTIQTGINKPRYPTLSNLLRAKKQKATVLDASTLPPVSGRERLVAADYPRRSRAGQFLEGDRAEKADHLLRILREKAFL
ncbi:MAG: electron transfer flavoprotein subunit beta/FixA family protein [Proteobacteria bacterium]|nr:electron transfer flavoprotein subunit beta/FixA family protein [Pseudomonadota bacterium]